MATRFADFRLQMGQHWILLTVCGFAMAGVVGFGLWWAYSRMISFGSKYRYRYSKIPSFGAMSPSLSSSSPGRRGGARRYVPTLFRRASAKEDLEAMRLDVTPYELYSRRD